MIGNPEAALILLSAREINAAKEQEGRDYHRDFCLYILIGCAGALSFNLRSAA